MKNLSSFEQNILDFAEKVSDTTYRIALSANTAQSVNVPSGARYVKFKSTADFYASQDAAASLSASASAGSQVINYSTTKASGDALTLIDYTSGYQTVSYASPKTVDSATGLAQNTPGYQNVVFSGNITFNTETGFSRLNDSTVTAIINVDGVGNVTQTMRKGDLVTVGDVLRELNRSLFSSALFAYIDSTKTKITIKSKSGGSSSSIAISGTSTLFAAMAGYSSVATAVAGTTTDYTFSIDVDGAAPATITVNGANAQDFGSLVAEINSTLTGAVSSVSSGKLRITSNDTTSASAIAITDVTLFAAIAGSTVDSATAPVQIDYVAAITVDSTLFTITINQGDYSTLGALVTAIDTIITTKGTFVIASGDFKVTSKSTGFSSTVSIVDTNLFASIPNFVSVETAIRGGAPVGPELNPSIKEIKDATYISLVSAGTPTVTVSFFA